MKKNTLLTFILFLIATLNIVAQTSFYVGSSGNNNNDGLSSENAFATLDHAYSTAVSGDKILVMGSVVHSTALTIDKDISIEGFNDSAQIDGAANTTRLLLVDGAYNVTLKNLTFANVNSTNSEGAVLLANGGALIVIDDCKFINNTTGNNGGAIRIDDAKFTITNSLFKGNTAVKSGGAIYMDNATAADLTIVNSTFYKNKTSQIGGALFVKGIQFTGTNLTIAKNYTTSSNIAVSGGIRFESPVPATLNNCIIFDNYYNSDVKKRSDIMTTPSGNPAVNSSIIGVLANYAVDNWTGDDRVAYGRENLSGVPDISLNYSAIEAGTEDVITFSGYSLPANFGKLAYLNPIFTDQNGTIRNIADNNVDAGAWEFQPNATNTGAEILLPVEVLGAEGTIEERTFTLSAEQLAKVDLLWMQVNNVGYQNKISIKINSQEWIDLNHNTVNIQSPEKERGGMAHGGHSTIRFTLPAIGFHEGLNTIQFRFNMSDAISNGFRVVKLNLLDNRKSEILDASYFEDDDPFYWEAPYTDAVSIAEGKDYWYNEPLQSNYLQPGAKGFWYGYELNGQAPINAKCASCHTQDGRDLEIFSYSNKSIIERSKFHMLTEEQGKKIASYIRSLSAEKSNVGRYGRPWNPPYQPGPEIANRSIDEWAAGAGLDAVLEADKDMLPHMFPEGVDQEKVYDRFDSDKMVDRTTLPIAIQFPDWKHWLPMIHPMDAYTKDDYWNNPLPFSGNQSSIHPKEGYKYFRNYLEAMPPSSRNPDDLMEKNRDFWYHYRFFLAQRKDGNSSLGGHWREPNGWATSKLADGVPRELAATSLARLMGIQFFEIMNEFNLHDKAHWFVKPEDQPADRQWFGENYQIFEIPPHFQACVSEGELPINDGYNIKGNCMYFHGQSPETGAYESTTWYHLQLIVNGGNGMVRHNSPMDYNYHPDFIMKASSTSGIYEPLRYYHSMNAMYQFRSWSGGPNPNDGRGFRIRVQGPWHIIGRTDSNQLNKFAPSIWPTFLDRVKPGMSRWVLNAQLRQFLTEVRKPGNNLDNWNRMPNGGQNELDSESKTTAQLKDMKTFVGLDYWADKFYYLFPEFSKLGVDCQILEEMIDWCSEAWPNINWEPFRTTGELQLDLISGQDENCAVNSNAITAQTSNEGDNPMYEWWINDEKVINNTNELDTSEIRSGANIKCRVTSSKNCISNGWVESEIDLPNVGFIVKVRKNGEAWEELNNSIACIDDTMEFKIDPELNEPMIWLDAMDVKNDGSEPTSGSAVTKWSNKSSSGFTLSNQTNSALRPTYSKTGMNGLPALMFGMNNADGLELFPTNNDSKLNDDWTLVVAGKYYRNGNGGNGWNAMLGNENGNSGLGFHFERNSGRSRIKHRGDNIYGRPFDDGSSIVVMIIKQGTKVYLYLNGRLEQEIQATSTYMESSRAFYLGQIDNGNPNAGWFHKGPISEVLFYDHSVTNSQKTYLEGYLTQKWNFAQELPSSHVYKDNSPIYVNLETPNGESLIFDKIESSNSVSLDTNAKFGDFTFTRPGCSESSTVISVTNTGLIGDDVVKYSKNEGKYIIGNQVLVTELDKLELLPNYDFNGDYQWEQPDGSLLTLNTNPEKFVIRTTDHLSIWKLHLKQDVASCILSDQVHEVTLNVTELPESEKDDDLDGVMNDVDQCPNTISGAIVDSEGCFYLPENNFNIEVIGESCIDENNGQIIINAANLYNYTATINDADTHDFTTELALENLSPGEYSICITIAEHVSYEQCFTLVIEEGSEVAGRSETTSSGSTVTENIDITSGTAPYTVSINGEEIYTTPSTKIAVDVNHGDVVTVTSVFGCEGSLSTDVNLADLFVAYPNPTNGKVEISIPNNTLNEAPVVIMNSMLQVIVNDTYKLNNGKIRVSLRNFPTGIYFVKINLDSPVIIKIVKN